MTINDVKKVLYKENPPATLLYILKGAVVYTTKIDGAEIIFNVPVAEMGDTRFDVVMKDSKHFNRYIVEIKE